MDLDGKLERFFAAGSFAVVGASDDASKYGNKVYRCYLDHKMKAFPVNPNAKTVMGNTAYPSLLQLPEPVDSVSIITPPAVTEKVVEDAIQCGVTNLWMQPGAENEKAIAKAEEHGLQVIHGGPCILVVLSYR